MDASSSASPASPSTNWMGVSGTTEEEQTEAGTLPLSEGDLRRALEFSTDVLHSRYELYSWCEDKVQNLVTVSGVLLGAAFLIITNDNIRKGWTSFDYTLASVAGVLLGSGLIVSLYHIIPKMNSGLGNETNPRVTIAIEQLSKDGYYSRVARMSVEEILRATTDQIKGMNHNIMRNQRAIRWASWLTISGLVVLGVLVARTVL
jgi:hypothetical protein